MQQQQPNLITLLDLIDLAHSLRQEQLFITNEQHIFARLSETLGIDSRNVFQQSWICAQQRQNLYNLIMSNPSSVPSVCCQRANYLDNTKFVEVQKAKALKHQHIYAYIDLINYLHRSPYLLAQCLAIGDRIESIHPGQMNMIIQTIATGLYGNTIHAKDIELMLKLLQELIEIEIVPSENPRRMLRAGSSVFARLYTRFHESSVSAKLFLTALLHEPIMFVLIEDELSLDIDPNKRLTEMSNQEKTKRFGQEGTAEYDLNVRQYRMDMSDSLFRLANRFVVALQLNWMLFPSTLRWLVQTMSVLLKTARLDERNVYEIVTDMVFTHFICPAVVSPDLYGICDAPISEVARRNLIQIGQILQTLAVSKYRTVDAKLNDLYDRFNKNLITGLLEQLMGDEVDYEMDGLGILALSTQQNNLTRNLVLATQTELTVLVDFLRQVLEHDGLIISGEDRRKLGSLLDQLPDKLENVLLSNGDGLHHLIASQTQGSNSTGGGGSSSKKQSIINLGKTTKSRLAKSISAVAISNNLIDLDEGGATTSNGVSNGNHSYLDSPFNNNNNNSEEPEQVLVIPLTIVDDNKFQLLTEDEVVNMTNIHGAVGGATGPTPVVSNEIIVKDEVLTEKNVEELDRRNEATEALAGAERMLGHGRQKHTRFSLTHDDASIGNTSDNLEAVSEAPSNHSVASSLELEDQNDNDNLSDMVSANVSGRGTPNISGRDTPSSQVTEGGGDNNPIPAPQMAKILIKTRSDIEDKFYKFEIKKAMEGDETVSIISDTWSTDVLASDSETVEANDRNFSTPLIPTAVILPGDSNFDALVGTGRRAGGGAGGSNLRTANILDLSETQSESAWSTDVLASDSEKTTEIDTDDNQSVTARSDITDSAGRERYYASTRTTPDSSFFAPRPRWKGMFPASESPKEEATASTAAGTSSSTSQLSSTTMVNRANNQFSVVQTTSRSYVQTPSSSTSHYERTFLSTTTSSTHQRLPLRQNSNESFASNHSSLNDDKFSSPSRGSISGAAGGSGAVGPVTGLCNGVSESLRFKEFIDMPQQLSIFPGSNEPLEDYTDEQKANNDEFDNFIAQRKHNQSPTTVETVIKSTTHLINPFADEVTPGPVAGSLDALMDEDKVEHRRLSQEQRNANFDSRRNGMSDMLTRLNSTSTSSSLIRLSDTSTAPSSSSSSSVPALAEISGGSVDLLTSDAQYLTDDYKNQAAAAEKQAANAAAVVSGTLINVEAGDDTQTGLLLLEKTKNLSLNGDENGVGATTVPNGALLGPGTPFGKSGKHTGAIPKSISFDSSADKQTTSSGGGGGGGGGGRRIDNRTNSGFFNKIKQGFKNRRSVKSMRHSGDLDHGSVANDIMNFNSPGSRIHYNHQNGNLNFIQKNSVAPSVPQNGGIVETSEDILAKYRRKASTSSDSTGSNNSSSIKTKSSHSEHEPRQLNGVTGAAEAKSTFLMAKRKLRVVLSASDLYTPDFRHSIPQTASPLLVYLQIQLAQAHNHQNFQQISYVSEAMRCLTTFDLTLHAKLFHELQQDLINRQNYLQYLIRYRQYLLSSVDNIERFRTRLLNERDNCNRYLVMVCVRIFLEKREQMVMQFQTEFTGLTVVDEKIDLLNEFMKQLMIELKGDGNLYGMVEWQLDEARICLERLLLQRLYRHVMFPNEDGDISRDHVLREHIRKLSRVTRPSHPLLRIPPAYLNEEPWTFAQQQLLYISAYKTPREKIQCVVRCITSLMNLLSMASDRVPAADDLTPVLIYVIIKANPPYLLSTIEYVNCFIGDELEGESEYWWCQFCSAVTFIKTMDYGD